MLDHFFSYFVTVVGFASAAYLTMSLKNNFGEAFWSSSYTDRFNKYLQEANFREETKNYVLNTIASTRDRVESYSRKRSCYMLMVCINLLLFICFFTDTDNEIYHFALVVFSAFNIIVVVFQKFIIKLWAIVFALWALGLLLFVGSAFLAAKCCWFNKVASWYFMPYLAAILMAVMVVLPLLVYWALNWLYSRVYMYYFQGKMGSSEEDIRYYEWAFEAYTDPTFLGLLVGWATHKYKPEVKERKEKRQDLKRKKKTSNRIRRIVRKMKKVDMGGKYEKYLNSSADGKIPMSVHQFCENENIREDLFWLFMNSQIQDSSK